MFFSSLAKFGILRYIFCAQLLTRVLFCSQSTFDDLIMHGPEANESNTSNLICIMCQNHTAGDLCEKCKPGYYKHPGTNECVPCQCNGHAIGNLCDPETGLDCDCQGNTQTPAECKSNSIEERLRSTCAASLQVSIHNVLITRPLQSLRCLLWDRDSIRCHGYEGVREKTLT